MNNPRVMQIYWDDRFERWVVGTMPSDALPFSNKRDAIEWARKYIRVLKELGVRVKVFTKKKGEKTYGRHKLGV